MKLLATIALLIASMNSFGNDESFMDRFFEIKRGRLVNVMAPCDPGCYVEIDINGTVLSTTTSEIGWEKLYELEDANDGNVTLNYSLEHGSYVIHTNTNTTFLLNGVIEQHPIDYALQNCHSSPGGQTTMGMVSCLVGAEQAWNEQLNITYNQLGGSNNKPLKNAQLAWIPFRDAQFNWFVSYFASKQGSKWGPAIQERRINVIRQQVEHLQSAYRGY